MADARPAAGSLGPRLAGRLTAELMLRSPQYMSAIKLYEIDLRGNKIAAIENLGTTQNQFDSIDLTDNAIVRLDGFSKLPRLKMLLLSNNRIARIARGLEDFIPNLEALVLTNNRISNLQDIEPLVPLSKLTMLSLAGNPLVTKPNYRLYVISRLPKLKVLDFRKVKQKERDAAKQAFASAEAQAAHATKTFEPNEEYEAAQAAAAKEDGGAAAAAAATSQPEGGDAAMAEAAPKASSAPSAEQMVAIKAAIANAQTLEEIQRLEEALRTGHLPSEIAIGGGGGGGGGQANGGAAKPDAMEVG